MAVEYITIGEIVNTHGVRGEVRLIPLTDFPERFKELEAVHILIDHRRFVHHIEKSRRHKQFIIIKFREVEDMNGAERLKGALVQITREQLKPLPEGSYYIFEIEGLDVFDINGEKLGRVKKVFSTGANDVYVVKPPAGKDILIPALKKVVKEINLAENRMVVELPEGLLDL
ncbi:16S rRNA processing protein RimM [Desulfohalotomaculum tongense]|uniref:ribosome maturation factor RimM n=1 Tax=Desulforadius tongensis TaxID=1216062 RepID=UPI00195BA750|nr:16S rRNA processing protein RimM [Desulforadius tongensis]